MSLARYLIRFDDICPGMNWAVWREVEHIIANAGIRQLLAVVPDNRDPELNAAAPDPAFWDKVRNWQSRGWSIGLHGFEHRYVSASAGLLGRNRYSEFAGLSETEQRQKLERALEIFRRERIRPDAWIAPAHSFDEVTVRLLAEAGIGCISDGYALRPYVCARGLLWVPQQLGRFRRMPFGLWTVCLHVNRWTPRDLRRFQEDVARFQKNIASLAELRRQYTRRPRGWSDRLFFTCFRVARSLRE